MTLAELGTLLGTVNVASSYGFWPDAALPPALPWISYEVTDSNNFAADGRVYFRLQRVEINLFTVRKDITTETALESALDGAELFWQKSETLIADERCYQVTYSVTI